MFKIETFLSRTLDSKVRLLASFQLKFGDQQAVISRFLERFQSAFDFNSKHSSREPCPEIRSRRWSASILLIYFSLWRLVKSSMNGPSKLIDKIEGALPWRFGNGVLWLGFGVSSWWTFTWNDHPICFIVQENASSPQWDDPVCHRILVEKFNPSKLRLYDIIRNTFNFEG